AREAQRAADDARVRRPQVPDLPRVQPHDPADAAQPLRADREAQDGVRAPALRRRDAQSRRLEGRRGVLARRRAPEPHVAVQRALLHHPAGRDDALRNRRLPAPDRQRRPRTRRRARAAGSQRPGDPAPARGFDPALQRQQLHRHAVVHAGPDGRHPEADRHVAAPARRVHAADRPAARLAMTDRNLRLAAIVLAALGLALAAYLTYVHYNGLKVLCLSSGGCETVQASRWAKLAGVPVALIGMIGYASILLSLFVKGENGALLTLALVVIGWGFSAYLT